MYFSTKYLRFYPQNPILGNLSTGKYLGCVKIFLLGASGDAGPPNVNLGTSDISKTTTARKLNLKILSDMVKYPFWVQKLLHYTIQHEGGRHIDFRQISVSPGQRLTTARRLSAYLSSRALVTTTTSSYHCYYIGILHLSFLVLDILSVTDIIYFDWLIFCQLYHLYIILVSV